MDRYTVKNMLIKSVREVPRAYALGSWESPNIPFAQPYGCINAKRNFSILRAAEWRRSGLALPPIGMRENLRWSKHLPCLKNK